MIQKQTSISCFAAASAFMATAIFFISFVKSDKPVCQEVEELADTFSKKSIESYNFPPSAKFPKELEEFEVRLNIGSGGQGYTNLEIVSWVYSDLDRRSRRIRLVHLKKEEMKKEGKNKFKIRKFWRKGEIGPSQRDVQVALSYARAYRAREYAKYDKIVSALVEIQELKRGRGIFTGVPMKDLLELEKKLLNDLVYGCKSDPHLVLGVTKGTRRKNVRKAFKYLNGLTSLNKVWGSTKDTIIIIRKVLEHAHEWWTEIIRDEDEFAELLYRGVVENETQYRALKEARAAQERKNAEEKEMRNVEEDTEHFGSRMRRILSGTGEINRVNDDE